MEKEFVPYEQSFALKELEFNEPCFGKYTISVYIPNFNEGRVHKLDLEMWLNETFDDNKNELFPTEWCSAPTYQQAFRWFREKYNLFGHILSIGERNYEWRIQNIKYLQDRRHFTLADIGGGEHNNTYEEAELECLKKLIEIVKEKNE
jgi:hypothetical protein